MVRSLHKTKILFAVALALGTPAIVLSSVHADNPQNLVFNVNVAEVLTVSITNPENWASGDAGFLRNMVNVKATTNSPQGLSASMYTKDTTQLRNLTSYDAGDSTTYIPTLGSSVVAGAGGANFTTNRWGYSVDDTIAGYENANYNALQTAASPITLTGTDNANGKNVFFAAKADNTMQSGTYAQTVYFAVVTGTVDPSTNPMPPVNPSNPEPTSEIAHYNPTRNVTTYTTRTTSGSGTASVGGTVETVTTTVATGDISDSYARSYGVTSSTAGDNTGVVAALGVAAGVSAVSGIAFFVAAKRQKDDEDEEG